VAPANGEDWIVHLVDTGARTETGGRLKRLARWIGRERCMMTYGDGVANVNISELLAFHGRHGKLATLTAVRPPPRFGSLRLDGDRVTTFREKSQSDEGWINGGYFVLEPEVLEYIGGADVVFEREPLECLAAQNQLAAYRHEGFWQCMDTLRDMRMLERLVEEGEVPWKVCPV
jgi:glucose-1-phosphate cytidylyltransferase